MRHGDCWRCCTHYQINWRTVYSRCKALAVVNHVTAAWVHVTSKAFIIKLAQFFCFCPFKISYPADGLQQRTHPIGRECSVTVSVERIQFLCPLHDFFQNQSHSASPGDALTAQLPDSVAPRKAQRCSALTVMIQTRCSSFLCLAAPPSMSPTSSPTTRGYIHVAVGMLLHTSYNKVPTF